MDEKLVRKIGPLFEKHWREVAHYQDIQLDPDWGRYFDSQKKGILKTFTARKREDDEIVGYAFFVVAHNLHYRKSLQAVQDIIFIDPEHRGFGKRFISWCDEQLKSSGVQAVYHHVKKAHNFGPLLERDGYELVDLIYAKRLDK